MNTRTDPTPLMMPSTIRLRNIPGDMLEVTRSLMNDWADSMLPIRGAATV